MIDVSVLPLFFTAIFFLVISPGPDLVLITAYSSTRGFRFGLMITLGIFLAGVVQTLLVAFGLGQLMQAMPNFAYGVKIVGALYLSWLGFKMLKSWYNNKQLPNARKKATSLRAFDLISKGLFSNLFNPKALIFFSLFIPQFTRGSDGLSLQILFLGMLLCFSAFLANLGFSLIFSKLGQVLGGKIKSGGSLARHIDGFLGVIFVGMATRLAFSK
ncbi:MAG: LysE family translocator [Halopseudomonas aestusnigri]